MDITSSAEDNFRAALECFDAMKAADTYEVLAAAWEKFLIYHQRVWNKAEAQYQHEIFWGPPKARGPVSARYAKERGQDPCLAYIHQARHVNEHGIAPVAEAVPETFGVGGTGYIGHLELPGGHVLSNFSIQTPGMQGIRLSFSPATVIAKPVVNKGVSFDPPKLGNHSAGTPLLDIAAAGVEFYQRMFEDIGQARAKFKNSG